MSQRLKAYQSNQLPLRAQILRECEEMAEFAFARGKRVPGWVVQTIHNAALVVPQLPTAPEELKRLAVAHETLARTVAPATPQALVLMDDESESSFNFLGPVPFVRRMSIAAGLSVAAFIWLSLSSDINNPTAGDIMKADGLPLLVNELFFMAAAGMGASFHALFEANRYLVQRSFDPRYEVSYWIKFLLGLIAGLIMVTLVPLDASSGHGFARPTLAMLGGFSAAAVYRILVRLVETMESLVQGDAKSMLEARDRATKLHAEQEMAQQKMRMTTDLVDLQQKLSAGAGGDEVRQHLNRIVNAMMTGDHTVDDVQSPVPPRTIALPNLAIVSAPEASAALVAPVESEAEPRALRVPDAEDMSDGEADAPASVVVVAPTSSTVTVAPAQPAVVVAAAEEEAVG